ncbi:hypothetical protein SO802_029854 [Lithocarpus litseifolius]|uniref:Endonuclease/exonuclease/phosphatase domain-containing protein n=1 Tax=Lithocarpus litseifolius TaxID=425828 RepID=A0AAW2BU91_9ROSI
MVRAKDPSVVFLAETWADEARLKQVQRKIQFENIFSTPRLNRGGGLVMFWRSSIDVSVVGSSTNYIDAIINRNKEGEWRFTGFYGEPETHKRIESWEQLRRLERKFQLPWICAGDFNELTRADEKLGGNRRSHAQMQLFRDAIDECGFIDLGYSGSKFTWRKHFANGQSLWERLDRALCTNDWLQQFGATKVFHLKSSTSDHVPIWIVPNGLDPPPLSRPFRFEEMWLSDKGCGRTVEAVWRDDFNCEAEFQVIRKIEKCGKDLTQWSRQHFGSVRRKLKKKKKQLEKAELVAMHSGNNFQVRELTKEVNDLLEKENKMWRQRAKNFWLIGGDKNTKYFHSRATQRCRRNKISGIFDLNGVWVSQPDLIASSFTDYYQALFTSSNPILEEATLTSVPKLITVEMNAMLSQEFMDWEVQTALKQMAPLKAPGPDGMPPLFYQNYWSLVGCDVTKTILSYLNTATLPHPLNHTFITLIPKIKKPPVC